MTSRCVYKLQVEVREGRLGNKEQKIIRLRLVLRGLMDPGAFSVETLSGTARRQSQRALASEAARRDDQVIARLDVDEAFLKSLAYQGLAAAAGERGRIVCFTLPPGIAVALRTLPGIEDSDESRHCSKFLMPGTGAKGAPGAISLKRKRTTQSI